MARASWGWTLRKPRLLVVPLRNSQCTSVKIKDGDEKFVSHYLGHFFLDSRDHGN